MKQSSHNFGSAQSAKEESPSSHEGFVAFVSPAVSGGSRARPITPVTTSTQHPNPSRMMLMGILNASKAVMRTRQPALIDRMEKPYV